MASRRAPAVEQGAKGGIGLRLIHSIDGVDLLEQVDAAAAEVGREPELLIQVDLAGESTKFGAPEADLPAIFDAAGRCKRPASWG